MNSDNGDNNNGREVNRDYFAFPPRRCRPSQPAQPGHDNDAGWRCHGWWRGGEEDTAR